MARNHQNFIGGTIADNPLLIGATTLNSSGLASLAVIGSPTTAMLVLDPQQANGAAEIIIVTVHTTAATSATITRGALSTTARQHAFGEQWVLAMLADDVPYLDAASNTFAGNLLAQGTDHYFGAYAAGTGTTVERIHFSTNAGVSMTIAAEGDTGNRNLNFKTFGSGGTFQWQTAAAGTGMAFNPTTGPLTVQIGGILSSTGGNTKFQVDTTGVIQGIGTDHYFGGYAFGTGTSVSRLRISADAGAAYLTAEGDGANRALIFQVNGTGAFQYWKVGGSEIAQIDSTGILQAKGTDHYFGGYAFGTGTSVSRLHVNTGAAFVALQAEGDGADRDFYMKTKGAGTFFWQTGTGSALMQLTSGGVLSGMTIAAPSWTAVTFQNSWVDYDASLFNATSYCKDAQGFVRLRGLIKSGTGPNNVAFFTLPVGFRPLRTQILTSVANDLLCEIRVDTSGQVFAWVGGSSAVWTSLDNLSFSTN